MNKSSMTPPPPTEEDAAFVRGYITYTVLLACADRDLRTLHDLDLTLSKLYIRNLDDVREDILRQSRCIRQQLRQRGIRLYGMNRYPDGIEAHYLCRGSMCSLLTNWEEMKRVWLSYSIEATAGRGDS